MTTIIGPIGFHHAHSLADIAAVGAGAFGYFVTIEHTYEMVPSALPDPTERAVFRFWSTYAAPPSVREVAHSEVPFPVAKSAVAALQKSHLVVLAQVNWQSAGLLFSWALPAYPPTLGTVMPRVTPVGLDPTQAQLVQIPPAGQWTTQVLRSRQWLFHPNIKHFANGDFAVSMNTADGRGIVWALGADGILRSSTMVPDALDPVLMHIWGKTYLFYRRIPSPDWSVFFHDTRYSGHFGPTALPLEAAELDAAGAVARITQLSRISMGNAFDFAVDSSDGHRVAIAVVTGTTSRPELRVYALETPLRLLGSVPVRSVPYRTTVAVLQTSVLVGYALWGPGGYEVYGLQIPW